MGTPPTRTPPENLLGTYPDRVTLVEVGPRDGFQMERAFIPTELKIKTIEALVAAGFREIEAVSFVHPRVIPQMKDAEAVMQGVKRRSGVRYWALVPNLRGAQCALAAGIGGLHLVICASETYNRENVGLSIDESIEALRGIVRLAGGGVPVAVTLAATFGCPFEGQLPDDRLVELARRLHEAGAEQIGLADSAGLGTPNLVRRIVRRLRGELPSVQWRLHLHDTRGLGLANAIAGLEEGVDWFDTSLGGLGGCPIIQGASGNIASEDFVNFCAEVGIETAPGGCIDLDELRATSRVIEGFLGRRLPSRVLASGTRAELYSLNQGTVHRPE